jgi:tRNA/tmRNA/rRNA uracil-C5-methylase (TrmA/RlmC/RlmD family)
MTPAWSTPLLAAQPRFIVAVHCGLAASIRDLTTLRESGYTPRDAALLDLFPGSPHGELMSFWERS